ncbi:MAG: hydroxymethylbilane synthase [Ignavibacteriota bacterium]|nr:MAG: hydroxymethylbilane synthase [Chlorobiota bacterium]MBE7475690.1 hydroxymethylbilane synthase [Ignavibacteriales bacterium]MBL1123001.1 hydroxymethylbilane synthase [Ignavibacteriota bacterium]MCC7093149.1 hydroxymethylbilane synthase [Ignavibacteriaceae bacterium]MEB2297245.1 hydroxymethylbilane synthase [Ignavibacteria bacterium]
MKNRIVIGSRGSELALWQANFVKKELEKKNKNVSVEIKIIKTTGDKILDVALSKIGDRSLFTKELEVELLNKKIDLAVHSLKDLQTVIPKGLKLSAVTKRHNVNDVLIARKKGTTIFNLPENAVVATGSLRRRCQLLHIRPDLNIVELRGNVPSRIKKFLESDWDAIILARAGVERLKLNKYISSIIKTDVMLPAVGQGALGIETRADNKIVNKIVKSIHHENTYKAVSAERALLKTLEGGCQVPIGAFAEIKKTGLHIDALVGSLDGSITYRKKIRGSKNNPENLGKKLANELLKAGAKTILEEIYKSARAK